MRIHTIQPAVGATTSSRDWVEVSEAASEKQAAKGTKDNGPAVAAECVRLKADKLLSQDVCPNVVSTTSLL